MVGVLVVVVAAVVDSVHTTIVLLRNSISFHLSKIDIKECLEEEDDDDDDDDDDTARVSIAATATTAVLVKSISPIE